MNAQQKCPKCGGPLDDNLAGGQCPKCIAQVSPEETGTSEQETRMSPPAAPQPRLRVLHVDDEECLTRLVKLSLERTGKYEVVAENYGPNAAPVARTFKPDVLLMNVIMPVMFGGDVAEQFKADPVLKEITIIFYTASVKRQRVKEQGGIDGGFPVIAKPASIQEISAAIDKAITMYQCPKCLRLFADKVAEDQCPHCIARAAAKPALATSPQPLPSPSTYYPPASPLPAAGSSSPRKSPEIWLPYKLIDALQYLALVTGTIMVSFAYGVWRLHELQEHFLLVFLGLAISSSALFGWVAWYQFKQRGWTLDRLLRLLHLK
jgi:CheY-like chemotaxis protein